MSTVAVTGARGFLGQHVVADLERAGHAVVRIGRAEDGSLSRLSGPSPATASLFDGVDGVIHLASLLSLGTESNVAEYLDVNVALSERLIRDAAAAGATSFVFASSRLVYPAHLGREATEADAAPDNAYGVSKFLAEQVLAYQATRLGIDATSLRISQLVGPGDNGRGALASFARAAFAGTAITVTGRGLAVRDFLDVRDAARALRLTVERSPEADALNIGSGGRTILELARCAAHAAGRDDASVVHRPVDDEDRSFWALDTSLAHRTIGWEPEFTLEQTLTDRWAPTS